MLAVGSPHGAKRNAGQPSRISLPPTRSALRRTQTRSVARAASEGGSLHPSYICVHVTTARRSCIIATLVSRWRNGRRRRRLHSPYSPLDQTLKLYRGFWPAVKTLRRRPCRHCRFVV